MTEPKIDELDLALLDALRWAPRATWRELAPVLGVDPATVGRRWNRLCTRGIAWITAHPAGTATPACALVSLDCAPGWSERVADTLTLDIEAATIKLTVGTRDVMVLAQAPDLRSLTTYLLDRVGRLPGVNDVRGLPITTSVIDGSRWRDGALDLRQRRRLESGNLSPGEPSSGEPSSGEPALTRVGDGRLSTLAAADLRMARALGFDGRTSLRNLASHARLGEAATRRRLRALTRAGLLRFRCDSTRTFSDRPFSVSYFATVPAEDLRSVNLRLRTMPGVRACNLVAGPANVVLDVWLRSLSDGHRFEHELRNAVPELRVVDRSVALRTVKHLGRVLDEDGLAVRAVPLVRLDQPVPPQRRARQTPTTEGAVRRHG